MEKIINYKIKDFLKLDIQKASEYLVYLDMLKPVTEITNPKKVESKTISVKDIKFLSFGQVQVMRNNFQTPDEESVYENVSFITGLNNEEVKELSIIDFYGVIASLQKQLTELANMEENALSDDNESDDDSEILYLSVNASQRMAKFGILNTINTIAGNDPLKWEAIQNLPYMTVFSWLVMDKTKRDIERDVARLQKQKQKQN